MFFFLYILYSYCDSQLDHSCVLSFICRLETSTFNRIHRDCFPHLLEFLFRPIQCWPALSLCRLDPFKIVMILCKWLYETAVAGDRLQSQWEGAATWTITRVWDWTLLCHELDWQGSSWKVKSVSMWKCFFSTRHLTFSCFSFIPPSSLFFASDVSSLFCFYLWLCPVTNRTLARSLQVRIFWNRTSTEQ